MEKAARKKAKRIKLSSASVTVIILLIFLSVYALSLLYMYFWGLLTSLKLNAEFRTNLYGLPKGWPWEWSFSNYSWAFNNMAVTFYKNNVRVDVYLAGMLKNSVLYALISPFVGLSVTWLIAYIIATFPKKFMSKFVFRLNIVLMMVPIIGSLPSALQLYKAIGIYDTWFYLVFVGLGAFIGGNLIIFHTYIGTVAKELREAASIDGAGNLQIMLRVVFPLTAKMYGILFLLGFIACWNDYMTMLIWLPSKPTIAFGIYKVSATTTTDGSWPPPQIAGCMLLALPMLAVFLVFKDKIIGQVTMGALKG